ncbi:hypothetical protein ABZV67_42130 [Streptomyces sp. NPDC005065]
MADTPPCRLQRRVDPQTIETAAEAPPKPQYAGLFVQPDMPPADDEPE